MKVFTKALLWLVFLNAAYFCIVSTAPLLPEGRLAESLRNATLQLNGVVYGLDHWADGVAMNIMGSMNPAAPVRSGMEMAYSTSSATPNDDGASGPAYFYSSVKWLAELVSGKADARVEYSRYWWGVAAVMRPVLSVVGLGGVLRAFMLCTMLLFIWALTLLYRKIGAAAAVTFAASMALTDFPIPSLSLVSAPELILALASVCAVLRMRRDPTLLTLLFLTVGSLDVFLVPLVSPMPTLLLPLTALVLERERERERERENFCDWPDCKLILLLCFAWAAGYILTWATKWVLTGVVLGDGSFERALSQVLYRAGARSDDSYSLIDRFSAIGDNVYYLFPYSLAACSAILGAAVLVQASRICAALRVPHRRVGMFGWLALAFLFLIPYLWYFVTAQHASIHAWFAFRNQASSVWLFLLLPSLIRARGCADKDSGERL
ncbi:MAG: hypothetical protein LBR38_03405 [Synergistaceae bacterium]|nr:hypothetical protein [Synergistaceae bacterium]